MKKLCRFKFSFKFVDQIRLLIQICSVCDSTGWVHHDSADAITVSVVGNLDVALVTPGFGPGILDDPVGLAVFDAIADGEDSMVEVGSTL